MWADQLFSALDADSSGHLTVAELVASLMPPSTCSKDAHGQWACGGAASSSAQALADRRRVGAQGALRYLMQLLAMDATNGTGVLADGSISLPELRLHASAPFYELCETAGDTAHVLPAYEGYLADACALLSLAGYAAEASSLQAQMAPL